MPYAMIVSVYDKEMIMTAKISKTRQEMAELKQRLYDTLSRVTQFCIMQEDFSGLEDFIVIIANNKHLDDREFREFFEAMLLEHSTSIGESKLMKLLGQLDGIYVKHAIFVN